MVGTDQLYIDGIISADVIDTFERNFPPYWFKSFVKYIQEK